MAYAGDDYGANGAWNGNAAGAAGGQSLSALSTSHASGVVVIACLVALIAIRLGFRGVDIGGAGVRIG